MNDERRSQQRPALVCLFCHQDDEFAVLAEIDAALSEHRRVECIYLTDGGYGGQSVERRNHESLNVLARMGVSAQSVHFIGSTLDIGDCELYRRLAEGLEAVNAIVGLAGGAIRLLIPAWEGGHHDHDAAHILGILFAQQRGLTDQVFQYPLYHGHGLPGPAFRMLSPLPANGPVVSRPVSVPDRLRYFRYCMQYPSQWKTWVVFLPFVALNYLFVGRQRLQSVRPERIQSRPHPGRLLYERRGFCTWEAFAEQTAPLRATAASSALQHS